jgi:hypothetical protein
MHSQTHQQPSVKDEFEEEALIREGQLSALDEFSAQYQDWERNR